MPLIEVKCKNCGANFALDDSLEKGFCASCGTPYVFEKQPVTVNIANISIGGHSAEPNATQNGFSLADYAVPFVLDEKESKHDWLTFLMSYDNAPLDIAYKAKIISMTKEYYPVAFYDVTCSASWRALSYWEHKEEYQVVEKHRSLSGEVEHRVVTKTRTIVDAVQQTNGDVPPKLYKVKVWMGDEPDSEFAKTILSWIDSISEADEVKDGISKEYSVIPVSRDKEEARTVANDYAHNEIGFEAKYDVPGDRYENFEVFSHIDKTFRTICYIPVYHIKYEYDGVEYHHYASGGRERIEHVETNRPIDTDINDNISSLQREIRSNKSNKTQWIVTAVVSLIIGIPVTLFSLPFLFSGNKTESLGSVVMTLFICAALVGLGILGIVLAVKFDNKANSIKRKMESYNDKNRELKEKIHNYIQDDSISDVEKATTIENWIKDFQNDPDEKPITETSVDDNSAVLLENNSNPNIVEDTVSSETPSEENVNTDIDSSSSDSATDSKTDITKIESASNVTEKTIKKKTNNVVKIVCICLSIVLVLGIGGGILNKVLKDKAEREAQAIVETFMEAATNGDIEQMNSCLSKKYEDETELLEFYEPDNISEVILAYSEAKPKDVSNESLRDLNEASEYFCENYISSYNSIELKANKDGTYSIVVTANIIDLKDFGDIYVEKTDEIADELATTYAKDLENIMATAKSDADAVERLYDLIMPDICQAVKESVKEADTVEEEFTFVVVNESGEYKIIEIEY